MKNKKWNQESIDQGDHNQRRNCLNHANHILQLKFNGEQMKKNKLPLSQNLHAS